MEPNYGVSKLQDLKDVLLNSIADKDILQYDLASLLWKNKPLPSSGGGTFTKQIKTLSADFSTSSVYPSYVDTGFQIVLPDRPNGFSHISMTSLTYGGNAGRHFFRLYDGINPSSEKDEYFSAASIEFIHTIVGIFPLNGQTVKFQICTNAGDTMSIWCNSGNRGISEMLSFESSP
jgi:hypothetical protein